MDETAKLSGGRAKKPRKTTRVLTDAELRQRREAAKHSTGPKTVEGKIAVSRNGWKHGLYSKVSRAETFQHLGILKQPCKSTCHKHPCSLVAEGRTRPGGDCLDKTVYLETFDAVISALQSGDATHTHGLLAAQAAQAVEVLQGMRESLARDGYTVMRNMVDRNGAVIGEVMELHPLIPQYIKLLDTLGINFGELMLTPRAVETRKQEEDTQDAFATLMGGLMQRGGGPVKRRTIDGELDDEDGE